MSLTPGARIGAYEVTGWLGAGGMGEVYRARDTRLGRDVVIKVLPSRLASDERRARFEREARVLASLNHPNIATLHGVEDSPWGTVLVMELVDGDTLSDRIALAPRGLPLTEALTIAEQVAAGLEAAHEHGIVHRDLKPANIAVRSNGMVKVLDFGLAKALRPANDGDGATLTVTKDAPDSIGPGTPAYMSPEQVRGLPGDRRVDVWAFGCVLYELLTGKQLFSSTHSAEVFAKILEREPDLTAIPAATPAPVRRLLRRCLEKNPQERMRDMGDIRLELRDALVQADRAQPASAPTKPGAAIPLRKRPLLWALAPLLLAAGFLLRPSSALSDRPTVQFAYPLPAGQVLLHDNRHAVEVSPDGRHVAFLGGAADLPRRIHVRSLEAATETALAGTENASNLAFAPEGDWIAFQQGQQIKKVSLNGGAPVVVIDKLAIPLFIRDSGRPPGLTWGRNGMIVFAANLGSGLSMVRETGGTAETFTELDEAAHEASHRLPHFLPDGSAVLFTVLPYSAVTPDWTRAQVWVKSIATREQKKLIDNAVDARYAGHNTLVFAREGKLFAVPFDPASVSVNGPEVQVLDGVIHSVRGTAAITWTGAAQYSISDAGDLFYGPGSVEPPNLSSLVWFDRQGHATPIQGMRDMFRFGPRVLPDGGRVAWSELYVNKDIWVFDSARGTEERATYEGQNAFPIWTPDGSMFAFRSDRNGPYEIFLANASNPREVKRLTAGPFDVPSSWTPDGKELIFTRGYSSIGGNTDIYAVSLDALDAPRPVVATPADERAPELSPDGKWLAYVSDDAGRLELYVQPYPGPGPRVTMTSGGAADPAWSKADRELFYRVGAQMMAVPFTVSGGAFVPGKPVALFRQDALGSGTTVRATYDVSPDGRFLFNQVVAKAVEARNAQMFPSRLRFVLNWTRGVQQLLNPKIE